MPGIHESLSQSITRRSLLRTMGAGKDASGTGAVRAELAAYLPAPVVRRDDDGNRFAFQHAS